METRVDPLLSSATAQERQRWLELRVLPYRLLRRSVGLITSEEPTRLWRAKVQQLFPGRTLRISTVPEKFFVEKFLELYGHGLSELAANSVYASNPKASAKVTLYRAQKIGFVLLLLTLALLFVLNWALTAVSLGLILSTLFLVSIVFKFYYSLQGAKLDNVIQVKDEELSSLRDDTLPMYTLLIPVYREANIIGALVRNLERIDWPKHRLQVLVLTEQDDEETRAALAAANPPPYITCLVVPDSQPRTKPKACNYGLLFARGEYLAIFDAEDAPDADQLKRAYITFRNGAKELVCVQAALNYSNARENLLTRMFTLEYSFWFDYMLPGLERKRLPIPLGGTSNHFVTRKLRALGAWDAWNVTEDADLGIRAAERGWSIGIINSTTLEEANNSIPNFINQRSRWIKGYLQTSLVHSRNPWRMISQAGLKQFVSFLLLVAGTPLTFLAVIPLYIVSVLFLLFGVGDALAPYVPLWLLVLTLANFIIGNGLMVYVSMMGALKRRKFWLMGWALLNPLYWLLHSVAAYKALWQLIVKPHYWEKTAHGLTREELEPEKDDEHIALLLGVAGSIERSA